MSIGERVEISMKPEPTGPVTAKKDWTSDQEVRWCPGCGDYGILLAVQTLMPDLGIAPENTVFVSGIGCSSRFPYYMDTYGIHSIHGRAPAIATGIAVARPDLDVWVITGDGDALSIGGNHLIHALRRNVDLTILLFNNRIYGLTKGQYSPTSEIGKVTKSTPMGSIDQPFNPLSVALGAEASFVARTHDLDRKHMMEVFRAAHAHRGASFVEIFQNCNVCNDDAFDPVTGRKNRLEMMIDLRHGEPIRFGEDGHAGVVMGNDGRLRIVEVADVGVDALLVHDAHRDDSSLAFALGAGARFVARAIDVNKNLPDVLKAAHAHRGASFVEIFQNCVVYNDDVFADFTDKGVAADKQLWLKAGEKMLFAGGAKGIALDIETLKLKVVEGDDPAVIIHDPKNRSVAHMLVEMPTAHFPVALGVIYEHPAATFDSAVRAQNEAAAAGKKPDLQALVAQGQTWQVDKEPRAE